MGCIMTDYKDLAFKPEMTWIDLCEYAKNKQLDVVNCKDGLCFIRCNGVILIKNNRILASGIITENRTYEQMKNIIDNLYGE